MVEPSAFRFSYGRLTRTSARRSLTESTQKLLLRKEKLQLYLNIYTTRSGGQRNFHGKKMVVISEGRFLSVDMYAFGHVCHDRRELPSFTENGLDLMRSNARFNHRSGSIVFINETYYRIPVLKRDNIIKFAAISRE